MKFEVLTLFPEMFLPVKESIIGRAEKKGLVSVDLVNIRDFSHEKHKSVDDTPVGGGPGMVMAADPAFGALESVGADKKRVIYMSPRGEKLSPEKVRDLSKEEDIVILCGHYEGVDQRILDYWDAEEISIGDYVLTGGELPAMVLIDAVSRLVPGVLSSMDAATEESIYSGLLEYPQYTRPADYNGLKVPDVLLSGDHKKVDLWRFEQSLILTKKRRPDLFEHFVKNHGKLTKEEYKIMEKVSLLL